MDFVSDVMQLLVTLLGMFFDALGTKLDDKLFWYAAGALFLVFLIL